MRLAFAALAFFLLVPVVQAQYVPRDERGSLDAKARTDLDGNQVRATVFNFGQSGRTGAVPDEIPYEWPRGTRRHYIALVGLFVGAEVESVTGETTYIVDIPNYRVNVADESEAWTWAPVRTYLAAESGEIARSDRPETWPAVWPDRLGDTEDPGWPGHWNGLLGKDAFIDGVELYVHYTDDEYDRNRRQESTTYYPDSTDLSRAGLGIVVSERRLAFRDAAVDDAVFSVRDLYNAGTEDLDTVGATIWLADLVGGDQDASDDQPVVDVENGLIVFADSDGMSSDPAFPGGQSVGAAALVLLESPVGARFTNVQHRQAGSISFQTISDGALYHQFMVQAPYEPAPVNGDEDTFASVGLFAVEAGASVRLATALVFGDVNYGSSEYAVRYAELLTKAERARSLYRSGFMEPNALPVSAPQVGSVVSGTATVAWDASVADEEANVFIAVSRDAGRTWETLADAAPNTGSFMWDTTEREDGVFYLLDLLVYGEGESYGAEVGPFTVDNPGDSAPQVLVDLPAAGLPTEGVLTFGWRAGDPEGEPVVVEVRAGVEGGPSFPVGIAEVAGAAGSGQFEWDSTVGPNSPSYRAVATASDVNGCDSGDPCVVADTTGRFTVDNPRHPVGDAVEVERIGQGTGLITVRVIDPAVLTGHTYRIAFEGGIDQPLTYDVIDEAEGVTVVENATAVDGETEGPFFDGLRLLIRDDLTRPNLDATSWKRAGIYEPFVERYVDRNQPQVEPDPADYLVAVGEAGVGTSSPFTVQPGGIPRMLPAKPVNFTIADALTGEPVPFAFWDLTGPDADPYEPTPGTLSADPEALEGLGESDRIILLSERAGGTVGTLMIGMRTQGENPGQNPEAGDVLRVVQFKAFQDGDVYRFQALPTSAEEGTAPSGFTLHGNFPNPFSAETNITFALRTPQQVRLEVFDVLGRRVAVLADGTFPAGSHRVRWDGRYGSGVRVGSGVYVVRLVTPGGTRTRKVVALR